jgi:hypothetical protein
MVVKFQPPPTYAEPILVDEATGKARFNPLWLKWFLDVAALFEVIGVGGINHELLISLLGGATGEHYHLTAAEHSAVASGITQVAVLAKITGLGANGSITFTNGIATAYTAPT